MNTYPRKLHRILKFTLVLALTKLLYKTQVLSALVIQNNGEIEDFNRVAASIIDEPSIRNVILAPDGIVSHVYPLEGNEAVIGFNYFAEGAGNKEAKDARCATLDELIAVADHAMYQEKAIFHSCGK